MRTIVVGPAPPLRGGIAKHTAGLTEALGRRGHHVEVISYSRLYPRIGFPGSSEREQAGLLGTQLLDTLKPVSWLTARDRIRCLAADVVVAEWWHPIAAPALLSLLSAHAGPIVVVCHNVLPHDAFPASRLLARAVLRRADFVLCHSRAVSAEVSSLVPGVARDTTPMPMLLHPPFGRPQPKRLLRGPAALFLGHVRPYKGVDVLVRAWQRARLPSSATLTIAGESYLGRGRLRQLVSSCGRQGVTVVDRYLPDHEVWERLGRARVLVLPYRSGTQSGVLPLALAAGLRVIASDVGGLAEPLMGDARHEIVPPGDADALARSLEIVLRDDDRGQDAAADAMRQCFDHAADAVQNSWSPTVDVLEWVAGARAI